MSQSPEPKFLVRDPQGNIFGPADPDLLRQWVAEGRIVPGMAIAPQSSPPPTPDASAEWTEASVHPVTRDALQDRLRQIMESQSVSLSSTTTIVSTTVTRADPTLTYGGPVQRQNFLGILSLAAGTLALIGTFPSCFCPCFAPVPSLLALAAVTMGAMGAWQVKTNPERYLGRSVAVTGLTLGVLTLLFYLTFALVSLIRTLTSHP